MLQGGNLFIGGTGMFMHTGTIFNMKAGSNELLQYSEFTSLQAALPTVTADSYNGKLALRQ